MWKHLYKFNSGYVSYKVISICFLIFGLSSWGCAGQSKAQRSSSQIPDLPHSLSEPQVIPLSGSTQDEFKGGVITADVNNDGKKDFIITKPGYVGVYEHSGKELWTRQIDIHLTHDANGKGLPGLHAPGVQSADIDQDKKAEILLLTKDNSLHILEGTTGETKKSVKLKSPSGAERWEHLVIANFRGKGDQDLLLQATNAEGYRVGRYLAAYALDALMQEKLPEPLWTRDDFVANAHSGARIADLDGDGKDEVLGAMIVSPDGEALYQIPLRGHVDSIFVADVRPDIPGLEVVALEEGGVQSILPGRHLISRLVNRAANLITGGGNRVFLYNQERLIWKTHYDYQEPQNAAVGEFDPNHPGLEIWCRSRHDKHQKPFIFNARGRLIENYKMDDVAPDKWTVKGVEVISTIDWTGQSKQLAAAKERHKVGDIAIFDPLSGQFLHWLKEKAARLYIADISGDWREEIIVLSDSELKIYRNEEPNPNVEQPSLWIQNHYRRSKMTWNYYNP